MKYLYGAAVQGIQNFIFQTSKLTEIVGASELVEEICTSFFQEQLEKDFKDENLILGAAGNIKYLFEDFESCQRLVKKFPKKVMEMASGITISQAVVKYENGGLNDALQELENRLRTQRNKVSMSFEIGFMGTERARRTGGVAFDTIKIGKDSEIVCEATMKKFNRSKKKSTLFKDIADEIQIEEDNLATGIDKICKSGNNAWIAVIHADGNGLGAIIQNLNRAFDNQDDNKVKNVFRTFSREIENSTKAAAQRAFKEVIISQKKKGQPYPVRPIVLGGDDLTIIIRADLALEFTRIFLEEFENQTDENFKFLSKDFGILQFEKGITACAGIAFVKKSYPFHYAVDLAEKLCGNAKKFVKETVGYEGLVPKSALAFFKVQDSFIESDLKEIKKRTLKAKDLSFDYGPYLIEKNDEYAHIGELTCKLKIVKKYSNSANDEQKANGISKLRQWVSETFKDKTTADFMLDRMSVVNDKFYNEIKPRDVKQGKSIIYDIIQLHSLKN